MDNGVMMRVDVGMRVDSLCASRTLSGVSGDEHMWDMCGGEWGCACVCARSLSHGKFNIDESIFRFGDICHFRTTYG